MSASNNVRAAIANGDLTAAILALGPDEHDTIEITIPGVATVSAVAARIGRTQIMVRNDGEVQVHVHEDEAGARECYAGNVTRARRAERAAVDGPLALLAALAEDMDGPTVPLPQRVPGATVPAGFAVMATEDPLTGLYL
jgi:hypothetical protein